MDKDKPQSLARLLSAKAPTLGVAVDTSLGLCSSAYWLVSLFLI